MAHKFPHNLKIKIKCKNDFEFALNFILKTGETKFY